MSEAAAALSASCPALLVAAPSSGQGKTSVTVALARWHARQGRRVSVFKAGTDFLDPLLTGRAAGTPCHQLDLWMNGEADVRSRLYVAAQDSDLILVEGVMGLFDVNPSSADFAQRFGLPVLLVVDAAAMAQTFGAVVHGLASYRAGLEVYAAVANRIGGAYHEHMLRGSLPPDVRWYAGLPRDDAGYVLPERHLGLITPDELDDLVPRLDRLADAWQRHGEQELPPPVHFAPAVGAAVPRLLQGRRIAVARDAAFAFLYPANVDLLRDAGAELAFFSPLAGDALPECDALWLPGGYPELHLAALSARGDLRQALHAHHGADKPILAEGGGMLFLLDELSSTQQLPLAMVGLLRGSAVVGERLVAAALQEVSLPEGVLRGQTFHHASATIVAQPITTALNPDGPHCCEPIYRSRRLSASFVHFYFPSNPEAALRLFLG